MRGVTLTIWLVGSYFISGLLIAAPLGTALWLGFALGSIVWYVKGKKALKESSVDTAAPALVIGAAAPAPVKPVWNALPPVKKEHDLVRLAAETEVRLTVTNGVDKRQATVKLVQAMRASRVGEADMQLAMTNLGLTATEIRQALQRPSV